VSDDAPNVAGLLDEADTFGAEGNWAEALGLCRRVLSGTHQRDTTYDDWVRQIVQIGLKRRRPDVAAYGLEYLLDHARAEEAWRQANAALPAARCLLRAGRPKDAAAAFDRAGAHARAADAWEQAGDAARAARSWDKAAGWFGAREDRYRHALCLLNLGLCLLGGQAGGVASSRRGREALSRAMVLLEEEADQAEGSQRIDRALSCFHALIHIGRMTATHENLAEGFLNCIRLMQQADHRFFVMQYFHDFAQASVALGEHHAAAEVMREASAWCRRRGLIYADHFLTEAATAFESAARDYLEAGAAAELSENALLASLDCFNRRGDVVSVQKIYRVLSELPLSDARRERYGELARQAAEAALDAPSAPQSWKFRSYYDEETAYPPTWRIHLVEADTGDSDPLEPIADALGDRAQWEVVRRRCLIVCLHRAESPGWLDDEGQVGEVVSEIARMSAPVALEPLSRLFDAAPVPVRAQVMEAVRLLPYRKSLEIVGRGISDEALAVQEAALSAIRHLVFPAAFPPLIRLFREHDRVEARREIVLALGRLVGMEQGTSRDALDFLLHTLRDGVDPLLEEDLRVALSANVTERSLVTLEHHMAAEAPGEIRSFIERLVSRIEAKRASAALGVG
jgi:tetratricopeptide (TPR) repeat protein